jgi:protein TonB
MERPSHIIFDSRADRISNRLPYLGLALCLQVSVAWLLAHELINRHNGQILPRLIEVSPLPEKQPDTPLPPPPDPTLADPQPVTSQPPIFTSDRAPPDGGGIHAEPDQQQVVVAVRPAIPDRAAVSIAATHTTPPYPPIARRIGAEGKVTLRLTVTAQGRVSQADIMTTSGRDDLDQTAQQWILAHWVYKPALANGVPVSSKALATVTFSLTNER